MASGIISGTTANTNIASQIKWSSVKNVAKNTSEVTASLQLRRTNTGFVTEGTGTFSLTIGSKTYTDTGVHLAIGTDWVTAITRTVTVSHSADGTKTVAMSASGSLPPSSLTSITCSGNAKLDNIPRASTFTCASSAVLGENVAITITRASSKFTHKITWAFGGKTGTIATAATTSAAFATTVGMSAYIPEATSGKCTITCTTLDGDGETVGDPQKKTVVLSVPESVGLTVQEGWGQFAPYSDNAAVNGWGIYVKTLTHAQATIDRTKISTENAYGATIASFELKVNGKTTTVTGTADHVRTMCQSAGTGIEVALTLTDTRGRKHRTEQTIDVEDYKYPTASQISVYRSDEAGNAAPIGTRLTAFAVGSYAPCGGKNSLALTVSGTGITAQTIPSGATYLLTSPVEQDKAYTVTLEAKDGAGNATAYIVNIPTAHATLHAPVGGRGLAVGKFYDNAHGQNLMQVNYGMVVEGDILSGHTLSGIGIGKNTAGEMGLYNHSEGFDKWLLHSDGTNTYIGDKAHTYPYGTNNVLWSGVWTGKVDTSQAFSQRVSAQPHGIVLVFSGSSSATTARDYHFTSHFVPKYFVDKHSGKGVNFFMMSHAGFETIGSKYFYITDTGIEGNDQNERAATVNGITFNNAYFVLRYVLGV